MGGFHPVEAFSWRFGPGGTLSKRSGQASRSITRDTRILSLVVAIIVGAGIETNPQGRAESAQSAFEDRSAPLAKSKLSQAQQLFFTARYDAAAALALELRSSDAEDLTACELRASALLFQLKAALPDQPDKEKAFKQCVVCADLLTAFLSETSRGQTLARARLRSAPGDEAALFFLGKLNLNYVWLQLGPLGRRTGWNEYWEARRSLDAVLKRNQAHVRARVARAWIDYVVDTKMPRGTRWVLGGGNKKRALLSMQAAAAAEADFFVHAEAMFALWDLHVRERNFAAATPIARQLARDFPDNGQLVKFLEKHEKLSQP